jgi:hypothetical protein
MMRSTLWKVLVLVAVLTPWCFAQQWEIGPLGGYGFSPNVTVSNPSGSADAGFKHGYAVGVFAGQHPFKYLSGEFRYLYRNSDLKLSSGGSEAAFEGEQHIVHYDLLIHTSPKGSRTRPFFAAGGGIKVFRGTGRESAFQPLNSFALLTKTRQVVPLLSVGGGVRYRLAPYAVLRVEVHDYITPFPTDIIVPAPGARLKGVLHDFLPMVGIGFTF